jgi:uncharacterized membrane protein YbaN (DUF454 family)
MSVDNNCLLLNLPAHVTASETELRLAAASILRETHARSITVEGDRQTAVVRLKANCGTQALAEVEAISLEAALATTITSATCADDLLSWVDPTDQSITFIKKPASARGLRKVLYLLLAGVSLLLGVLGIVLPGLPTTPFVLLGSFFLVRSSARMHDRLLASRVFGGVLRDWYIHRGLRPHVRARAVAVVAAVVVISLLVARPPLPAVVTILALAACGLAVIWRLPSVR